MRKVMFLAALASMGLFLFASTAFAAGGECTGYCGTPNQSGGGGCGCGGGSILVNNTDLGDTYQYSDDFDTDGIEDDFDNCPYLANVAQLDSDGDGIGDLCDSCAKVVNPTQIDTDGDGEGDACDIDIDNDGELNEDDNCKLVPNTMQIDTDGDKMGDACDTDDDNDLVLDIKDNCPLKHNPLQDNADINKFGDACDADADLDNVPDSKDNCPTIANDKQEDTDKDGIGDACDQDIDNDGVTNLKDNCKFMPNPRQLNADRDELGDACDPKFCFVVRARDNSFDQKQCLDPSATFKVFSPDDTVGTGEPMRLRLFANRPNRAIEYTWMVTDRPAGSVATVESPRGSVNTSSTFEYFYLKGNVARFTPDEPGIYKLKLNASLMFADTANPNWPTESSYVVTVTAEGEGSSGCAVGGSASGTGLILLGLLGLVALRRRWW
jgi:MYXO-CTERM domain-containing protein